MGEFVPRALTIAGSDSGGGAGIQADLKTFTAHKVFGASVVTCVTAQNTQTVEGVYGLPPEFVELEIDAVLSDIGVDAVKTGMLYSRGIISSVAKKLDQYKIEKLVVDPVMVAKGGVSLLEDDAVDTLIAEILPKAAIVTPNIPEAERLTGLVISGIDSMREAAHVIINLGPGSVVVKGGHLDSSQDAVDLFYDGERFHEFRGDRINTNNTHGTGCTYSASICAELAKGAGLPDAVKAAKSYITGAISGSFELGKGYGPLNHYWKID